jgi:hypothetical protein
MYVTVSNNIKGAATVHLATCADLGEEPLLKSVNSDRRAFDTGLEALAFAREERPNNYGFCSHCLSGLRWVR